MIKIDSEMINFPSNEHETPGYLCRPREGRHPGVVLVQEWWGLVPHIKNVAERLARHGYVTLAPDLYHGEKADEPDEARKLAMALDRERAVAEIVAAVDYLKQMDQVSSGKIGVVGWCMGGGLALSTAAESDQIGAVVAFYGQPLDEEDAGRIDAPVLGLYAEKDHHISVESVREFEEVLQEKDVPHTIRIYPGAHHAFFNETRDASYDPDAAMDAWERLLAWFDEHLGA